MSTQPAIPPSALPYPIGTPGTPWGAAEKAAWLGRQRVQRSHAAEVLEPLKAGLASIAQAELFQYGTLDYQRLGLGAYALHAVRSRAWRPDRPTVLVTGGVHGYETINRWNPDALDPNRQFKPDSPAAEAALAMACIAAICSRASPSVDLHIDLHETTDTDNSEFGPAKAARDGVTFERDDIPDGFYLVDDADRPAPGFQRALIDAVRRVTHIAEPDVQGRIIGAPLQQPGVISFGTRSRGLCGGVTDARLSTTTEVYPDSPRTNPDECNEAQRVAVTAAIDYLLRA